jgi:hypothetical protein
LFLQKPLVSFRAGIVNSERAAGDATRLRMRADTRKGELRVVRGGEGVMSLEWRDRVSGTVAHSFMVFPNDVAFRRIRTGRESDRVYELKFLGAGDSRRFFFYMQSSKVEGDEENARKLVDTINNPPAAGAEGGAAGGRGARAARAAGGAGAGGPMLTQEQLAQMLANVVGVRYGSSRLASNCFFAAH